MRQIIILLIIFCCGCSGNAIKPDEFGANPKIENHVIRHQILAYVAEQKALTAIYGIKDFKLDNLVSLKYKISGDTIIYRIERITDMVLFSEDENFRPQFIRKLDDVFVACYDLDKPNPGMPIKNIIDILKNDYPEYLEDYKKNPNLIGKGIVCEGDFWMLKYMDNQLLIKTIEAQITDRKNITIYPLSE